MRALLARWVAFWDQREAPTSLALLRILVGAVLLGDLLDAFSCDAVALLWAAPPFGAGVSDTLSARWLGASEQTAFVLWGFAVLSCVLMLLGAAYRVSSWLLVFAMIELMHCQPTHDGADVLLRIVLPLLAMSGANAEWSVDAWLQRRRGRPPRDTVPAWPRYLIVLQLVWIYFSAAHHRGRTWLPRGDFTAIGNVLSDPHFARFPPGSLHALYPLMRAGTLLTMIFELSAPLFLLVTWLARHPQRGGKLGALVRRSQLRWIWLSLGVSLHLGIACTMRIGMFPFAMLALYPAFLAPDEIRRVAARISSARNSERAAGDLRPAA